MIICEDCARKKGVSNEQFKNGYFILFYCKICKIFKRCRWVRNERDFGKNKK